MLLNYQPTGHLSLRNVTIETCTINIVINYLVCGLRSLPEAVPTGRVCHRVSQEKKDAEKDMVLNRKMENSHI